MVKKALSKQKNVKNFADMLRYTRSHVQIKKHVKIKSESLIFYGPFLPVQISTVSLSVWFVYDYQFNLLGNLWRSVFSHYRVPSLLMQTAWGCGQGLSLKRSFTSCSEAQVKPRGCPSLIWISIRPINGQITRTTLNSSVRSLWCGEHGWKKLSPKPVGIIAKTSLPSSKRFTGIFCSSFSSKLKSELIKSSRNAPWTKSTDGLRDEKCPEVVLVSVTCQFKPIGSLRSSANAGYSKINSSRAGSLYLAPFFSPALGRGSPS